MRMTLLLAGVLAVVVHGEPLVSFSVRSEPVTNIPPGFPAGLPTTDSEFRNLVAGRADSAVLQATFDDATTALSGVYSVHGALPDEFVRLRDRFTNALPSQGFRRRIVLIKADFQDPAGNAVQLVETADGLSEQLGKSLWFPTPFATRLTIHGGAPKWLQLHETGTARAVVVVARESLGHMTNASFTVHTADHQLTYSLETGAGVPSELKTTLHLDADDRPRLEITGPPGLRVTVDQSDDLQSWTRILGQTVIGSHGTTVRPEPGPRWFRVRSVP